MLLMRRLLCNQSARISIKLMGNFDISRYEARGKDLLCIITTAKLFWLKPKIWKYPKPSAKARRQ